MNIVPQSKVCSKCNTEKPLTEFAKRKRATDGRKSACKSCNNMAYRKKQPNTPRRALLRLNEKLSSLGYKRCGRCKRIKLASTENYNLNTHHEKDGFQVYCRTCEREYYHERGGYNREQKQRWNKENAAKVRRYKRRWKRNNREAMRVYDRRRRSRKNSLPNTLTVTEWENALAYFNHACAVCGRKPDLFIELHLDHWIPLASDKTLGNVANNVVPLCGRKVAIDDEPVGCNQSKGAKDPLEWLIDVHGEANGQRIYKRIQDYLDSTQT